MTTHALSRQQFGCSPARSTACDAGGVGGLARFHGCGAWASGDDAGTVAHPGLHRCNGCWGPTCREIRHIHRPGPIFLTDITLLLLFAVSLVRWPSRILYWLSEGVGAGPVGRVIWILCILATVYFVLAFSEYGLYAVRDLAIFGYSLFFPLTCFAIRDRRDAVRLLRYLTYAGVILALCCCSR